MSLSSEFPDMQIEVPPEQQLVTLPPGAIDPRLLQLSYSSLLLLHECPRKYQLYKLNAAATENTEEQSLTFAYGHIVGEGVQLALQGLTQEQVIWRLFLAWKPDLLAENPKQKKSFFLALAAVRSFYALRDNGFLEDYELLWIPRDSGDLPACELSFRLTLLNGFKYRSFIDAVLRHKYTGEVLVLEVKTTSAVSVNPAQYKNSNQATGYSTVLDAILPGLSEYAVQYLVYQTKEFTWLPLEFQKSVLDRASWITEVLLDAQAITKYNEINYFPMHGEACLGKYSRECEYFQLCRMSIERITKPLEQGHLDKIAAEEYHYELSVFDLMSHVQNSIDSELEE